MTKPFDKAEFYWNGKPFSLHFKNNKLLEVKRTKKTSEKQSLSANDVSINILNVICTSYEKDETGKVASHKRAGNFLKTEIFPTAYYALIIHYWEKRKHNKRKHKVIELQTYEENDCLEWHKLIQLKLTESLKEHRYTRPCKLLVFINPFSGKKKAQSIYKKFVSPLFKLAGIKETVVVSQYRDYAKEYAETNDLSSYDGVIVIGGDGTFNEMANGVLIAEQRKRNISLDQQGIPLNQSINFTQSSIKLGLIAAGSVNTINRSTQGTTDPETATLQIICGESHPMDVISTYNCKEKFVRFYFTCATCGVLGYSVVLSERLRSLGPIRYGITNVLAILKRPLVPCKISYLPSSPDDPVLYDSDPYRCRHPCPVCLDQVGEKKGTSFTNASNDTEKTASRDTQTACTSQLSNLKDNILHSLPHSSNTVQKHSADEPKRNSIDSKASPNPVNGFLGDDNWKSTSGEFFLILCLSNAFVFDRSPLGFAPSAHLSDGTVELKMGRKTSRTNALKYLVSVAKKKDRNDFSFMEAHRVKALRFQPLLQRDFNGESSSSDKLLSVSELSPSDVNQEKPSQQRVHGVWCNDGEVIEQDVSSLWVHRGLVTIFASGIESEVSSNDV